MLEPSRSSEGVTTRRRFGAMLLVGAAFALGLPAHASAQSKLLDAPRAAGLVAERYDGFAVVRGSAPADVVALVAQVNAERRAVYAQRAAADKAPTETIGKIYAVEIMKSAPTKTWFIAEGGQSTQK